MRRLWLAGLWVAIGCAGCCGCGKGSESAAAGGEELLTVKVIEYNSDAMHSTSVVNGAMAHLDWFDAATCEVEAPAAYAGQKIQIWGWNRQDGPLDSRFYTAGNVIRLWCKPGERKAPPWASGPSGFEQREIRLEPAQGAPAAKP